MGGPAREEQEEPPSRWEKVGVAKGGSRDCRKKYTLAVCLWHFKGELAVPSPCLVSLFLHPAIVKFSSLLMKTCLADPSFYLDFALSVSFFKLLGRGVVCGIASASLHTFPKRCAHRRGSEEKRDAGRMHWVGVSGDGGRGRGGIEWHVPGTSRFVFPWNCKR